MRLTNTTPCRYEYVLAIITTPAISALIAKADDAE